MNMSTEKKIKITIDPLGKPTVEAIGFNGVGCEAATSNIEKALAGGQGMERTFKPEWANYGSEENQDHEQVKW
jgi:hypothetical protein